MIVQTFAFIGTIQTTNLVLNIFNQEINLSFLVKQFLEPDIDY